MKILKLCFIVLLCFYCTEKEFNNPFDPESELSPEAWAPTNLQAEVLTDSQIKLTWSQDNENISGFKIERKADTGNFAQIAEVALNVTEYTDTGLSLDTDYTYRVQAFTDANESSYTYSGALTLFYDCDGEFMGTVVEDCFGECGGTAVEDCFGECGGTAVEDCAGVCEGEGVVLDGEGNEYETVRIDGQCWMAENLKTTHYNNGDEIQYVQSESSEPNVWENLSTGAYGYYNDDLSHLETYGNLYNWYAVDDARGICPEGWHVPTDEEYQQLEIYLGMEPAEASASGWHGTDEGGKMKETGTEHWNSPNTGATNESGFTGLPAGYRSSVNGFYYNMGNYGYFWSSSVHGSSNAWYRVLFYGNSSVGRSSYNKHYGFSVRCAGD